MYGLEDDTRNIYHYQILISNTATSQLKAAQAIGTCPPSMSCILLLVSVPIYLYAHLTQPYQLTAHRLAIDPLIFHAPSEAHTLDVSVQGKSNHFALAIWILVIL
jgi:hypothetical protein